MIKGRVSKRRFITLGADPEVFVFAGLKLIPAYRFLPPKEDGRLMYWDGFQAEWKYDHEDNFCLNNLVKYTRESLIDLSSRAKEYNKAARLSLKNVVRIPKDVLENAYPQHVELGCAPSWNVYGMKGLCVLDPRKLVHRFAGGHMHFGTWTPQYPQYAKIVKTLDNILGVWSVGAARNIDDPIRRRYYGSPGEYRKPEYGDGHGIEYRVLSNFWLASPSIMQLTWDIGRTCVRLASSRYASLWAGEEKETIDTIKNCDYEQANKIIKRNEPMFRWILKQSYGQESSINRALVVGYNGLEEEVPYPEDFKENWHFATDWLSNASAPWARWEPLY